MKNTQIVIGYQGYIGSNSEAAARNMAAELALKNVSFLPLISSENVVKALLNGEINYGIMAIKNSIAGVVKETSAVIHRKNIELKMTKSLTINHCLFKKPHARNEDLTRIASHEQALAQTKSTITELFPKATYLNIEDTAIGAKWLSGGKLDDNTAVICSRKAGADNKLELIKENIQDDKNNQTEFGLFSLNDDEPIDSAQTANK